ncbi:NAD(P)/FAD-dependent oxidoreductase [Methylobacterium planeticum]|uniref:FAD-dependent oxidoreductase n=1 Tax=Methylobacterium planeticum TaxID=2615211 RepID=A0A6N6MIC6_9HYPH|nr:FAD-dependent oxidoreductase [Methylobacterium planeticum]KAB1070153.1 FAD-dependent oxidoreductase [Methylobacterium planeticum]
MSASVVAERAVVVGAGLAGLRGAEALRRAGFTGSLTLVGAEAHRPYDRPPLSKHVLTGAVAADATTLPSFLPLEAEWRLGTAVTGLDRRNGRVRLADGSSLAFDRLLIATGTRARAWPNPHEGRLAGVHSIRSREDATALRTALAAGPRRVLVIGGGFIGCEMASACRTLGIPVTLVEPSTAPLARVLGTHMGDVIGALHTARGVEMRCGTEVEWLEDDGRGRVVRAHLSGGDRIEADLVVVALGAVRNTEWLAGSGLSADAGGLDCDADGYALDTEGRVDARVAAAGDVARFPHPLYDGRRVALEHWSHAVAQAEHAGRLLADRKACSHYAAVPTFWSTQHGINIKSVGLTEGADGLVIAQGSPKEGRFLAVYGREGRCIAALSVDCARWLPAYAAQVAARAPFPPIHGAIDQPEHRPVLPPGFS